MWSPLSAPLTSYWETSTISAKRKIVGVTCSGGTAGDWKLPTDYVRIAYIRACEKAGLFPLMLPTTADDTVRAAQLELVDGLLLTGGEDVDPRFYGDADRHPMTELVEERRDLYEIALVQEAIARDLPIFAICRGMQVLNVALGGTLIQHTEGHRQETDTSGPSHCVQIAPESRLAQIWGHAEACRINSHHHQAVGRTAPSLTVTGRAEDGTVEALERPESRFVLAVQWHPENLYETDALSRSLFTAFADAL